MLQRRDCGGQSWVAAIEHHCTFGQAILRCLTDDDDDGGRKLEHQGETQTHLGRSKLHTQEDPRQPTPDSWGFKTTGVEIGSTWVVLCMLSTFDPHTTRVLINASQTSKTKNSSSIFPVSFFPKRNMLHMEKCCYRLKANLFPHVLLRCTALPPLMPKNLAATAAAQYFPCI